MEEGQPSSQLQEKKEEHYEVVAGTPVGHGKIPLLLLLFFAFLVIWAAISWIPFFGY
jgi:hypothetical protein